MLRCIVLLFIALRLLAAQPDEARLSAWARDLEGAIARGEGQPALAERSISTA